MKNDLNYYKRLTLIQIAISQDFVGYSSNKQRKVKSSIQRTRTLQNDARIIEKRLKLIEKRQTLIQIENLSRFRDI